MTTFDIIVIERHPHQVDHLTDKRFVAFCITPIPLPGPFCGAITPGHLHPTYGRTHEEAKQSMKGMIEEQLRYLRRDTIGITFDQIEIDTQPHAPPSAEPTPKPKRRSQKGVRPNSKPKL